MDQKELPGKLGSVFPLGMPLPSRKEGCMCEVYTLQLLCMVFTISDLGAKVPLFIVYLHSQFYLLGSGHDEFFWVHNGTHAGSLVERSSQGYGPLLVTFPLPSLDYA